MVVAKAGDGELLAREEDVMINSIFSDIVREIPTAENQKGAEDETPKLKTDWNGDAFELVSSDEGWQIKKKDAVVSGIYRFASPPQKIAVTDSDGDGDADVTVTLKDGKRKFVEGTEIMSVGDPLQEADTFGDEEGDIIDDLNLDDPSDEEEDTYDPSLNDPLYGIDMDDENDFPARLARGPKPLAPLKDPAQPDTDTGEAPSETMTWDEFAARPDIADVINQIGTIEGCADEQIKLTEQDVCAEFSRDDLEKAAEAINAGIDFSLAPKKRIVNLPGDTVIGDKGTPEDEGEADELDELLKESAKAAEQPPPKPRGKIILPPPPPQQEGGPALSAPPPDKASFECDEFLPDIAEWKECLERPLREADKFAQEAIDYFGKELTCPTTLEGVGRLKDIVAEYDKNPSDFDPAPLMDFTPIEPYGGTQYHLPLMCGYNFSFERWVGGINYYFLDKERVVSRSIIGPTTYGPEQEIFMRYLGVTGPRDHKTVSRKFGPNLFKQEYDSVGMPGTYDKDRIEKIRNDLPEGNKHLLTSGAGRFIPLTKDLYVYSSRDAAGEIFLYGLLSIPRAERFLATACKQEIWRKDNPNDIQGEDEVTAFDLGIALLLEKAEGLGELTDISKKLGDPSLALPAPTKARLMKRTDEINRTISLRSSDIVPSSDYAKALLEKYRGESACRELGKRRENTH